MASVIISWKRVAASVRVRPPAAIRQGIRDVLRHEPLLQPLIKAAGGEANAMEVIYLALKESVQGMNDDKRHFLQKLKEHNEAAEALADYLEKLTDQAEDLADDPYNDCNSQPRSWLARLPVRQIPIPVLNLQPRRHSRFAKLT